jgi:hypothetical protein
VYLQQQTKCVLFVEEDFIVHFSKHFLSIHRICGVGIVWSNNKVFKNSLATSSSKQALGGHEMKSLEKKYMLLVVVGCLKKLETFKSFLSFFLIRHNQLALIVLGLHHGYCCYYNNNSFIDCASNGQQWFVTERKANHNGLKEWNLKTGRKKKTSPGRILQECRAQNGFFYPFPWTINLMCTRINEWWGHMTHSLLLSWTHHDNKT